MSDACAKEMWFRKMYSKRECLEKTNVWTGRSLGMDDGFSVRDEEKSGTGK